MATVNYTAEQNLAGGYVKVEWSGLTNDDVGQPFDCAGFELVSYYVNGGTGGGTIKVEASNEITPTTFRELFGTGTNLIQTASGFVGSIRPTLGSGSGGNLTVALLFRRPV